MSQDLLLSELQIYLATACILFSGGALYTGLALRESGYKRFILFLGAIPALAMSVAYVMMGFNILTVTVTAVERQQSIGRFFAYTVILLTVPYVLKELVSITRRQFVILAVFLLIMPWSAFISWITTGAIESAMSATAFVAYLSSAYLLYIPYANVAREVGGQRHLLYIKLCHLAILSYGVLIITSGLSEQSAGLLDFFVGQLVASYADVIFLLAFGGLIYTNAEAFEEESTDSTPDDVTRERSDPNSVEAVY